MSGDGSSTCETGTTFDLDNAKLYEQHLQHLSLLIRMAGQEQTDLALEQVGPRRRREAPGSGDAVRREVGPDTMRRSAPTAFQRDRNTSE